MTTTSSRLATLVLGLAVAVGLGTGRAAALTTDQAAAADSTPPPADGGLGNGDDNVAVAANTHDGRTVFAFRLKVVQTGSDVVDATNAAVAAASCRDCTTVAIAIEAVLLYGDVHTFTPVNLALALNTECTNCQTLAAAYQTMTQNDSRVRITGEGRRRIAELRRQLHTLPVGNLDVFALAAEADRIAGEFFQVLRDETLPVGRVSATPEATPSADPGAVSGPAPTTDPAPPSDPEPAATEPTTTDATMPEPTATDATMPEPTATDATMPEPTATATTATEPTATDPTSPTVP